MAKKNTELFDRLRQIGLRKQAAKAFSEVSQSAGNKAQRAARAAVSELRALADEIEQRLPAAAPPSDASAAKRTPAARARKATPASRRSSAAGTRRAATTAKPKARGSTTRPSAPSRPQPMTEATESVPDNDAPEPVPPT